MNVEDPTVLVVVVNSLEDMERVRSEGWYRIPVARAPRRIAAEYLAFYQTGAFPAPERWAVRWLAPVLGYQVLPRVDLLPEQSNHPRAAELYYKISLGPCETLPLPVPSRRLRRITFISTTLSRLHSAEEINDLWIKSTAQERLWTALRNQGVAAERQFPLDDDLPHYVVDFAVPEATGGGIALLVEDEPAGESDICERRPPDYILARAGWHVLRTRGTSLLEDPDGWAKKLAAYSEPAGSA